MANIRFMEPETKWSLDVSSKEETSKEQFSIRTRFVEKNNRNKL